ncbi:Calcium/calmodulin dependent protein kinase [Trichophyton interdigitale]|uniref:Calcium/calmodulin dependent protein kinase n=1 Tax=Trichophyton interdigitale TaxID=101480 RepID=A0A9P5CW44_9EURO|nr:Calcium/calmodulin dependent protein kinase [Trichophyton interdigitale]KAF3896823.1 Calcium/calmodulin dependent protein kinase [Trichophyton interdigitale]KAG8209514.1 Calcium/calmodulin dependent protein kinase [Trichophyton interdigitale]
MAERSMFVYRYLTTDFLNLPVKTELPLDTTKRVLRDALKDLAALHDNNIMHNDIKANNILVDQKDDGSITDVRLGDIEDAAIVPPSCGISGRQMGNWMWRSPESHAEGPMTSPSDIFSFAVVCIYAVHRRLIFSVDESELGAGEILAHVIEQQIPYFADEDSIQEFLELIRESPWAEVFKITRDGFNKENPRKPFALWKGVDPVFKELICRMTHFNPMKRITAREALEHDWFKEIVIGNLS